MLGGDTVYYSHYRNIKKDLAQCMKEIKHLKPKGNNDDDTVFRLTRIIPAIWQVHPFREGNTRTCIVFGVLLAKSLGFSVNHDLLKDKAAYVRNSLVWASQGIYSRYDYFEDIFFDAVLGKKKNIGAGQKLENNYEKIGDYEVKNYKEQPHKYIEGK